MSKKISGYWKRKGENNDIFPMPIPNILTEEQALGIHGRIKVTQDKCQRYERVNDKAVFPDDRFMLRGYRGYSSSRITGEILGTKEYETEHWIWPQYFAEHYVLKHKVKPHRDFLEYLGVTDESLLSIPDSYEIITREQVREFDNGSFERYMDKVTSKAANGIRDRINRMVVDELIKLNNE